MKMKAVEMRARRNTEIRTKRDRDEDRQDERKKLGVAEGEEGNYRQDMMKSRKSDEEDENE